MLRLEARAWPPPTLGTMQVLECWDRKRKDYVAVKIIRNIQVGAADGDQAGRWEAVCVCAGGEGARAWSIRG